MVRDGLHERCQHFIDGDSPTGPDNEPRFPGHVRCAKGLMGVDYAQPWPDPDGRPRVVSRRGRDVSGWWVREDCARCDSRGGVCPYKPVADMPDTGFSGSRRMDPDDKRYLDRVRIRRIRAQ